MTWRDYEILRGSPIPLGTTIRRDGINFAVFSRHATSVTLVIFMSGQHESMREFALNPNFNRTGDIWHAFIRGLDPGIRYGYRVDGPSNADKRVHRYDPAIVLLDPYAKAYSGASKWGKTYTRFGLAGNGRSRLRSLIVSDEFDWERDQPLNIPLADSIIYELHARGFTRHASSGVQHPGTFAGLIERIPYLKELGITAVELLPINEFDESHTDRVNPISGEPLTNFWGYSSIGFFAPKASYAHNGRNGGQVQEFKSMVKAMHRAGIEVILDIVFNHTAEGNELGPTYSFKGLDNSTYYILDSNNGAYLNYSGCGNTMNCNHPVVRDLILDALRYWVTEMHVDGFRFDLASILGRGQDGSVLANPPVLERIAYDPVLANTKLIAEAWDAAGLYQVGQFPAWGRWAELNGKFRDDIRRFLRGDPGLVPVLASRLLGSPDLYQGSGRAPYHSINFITSHDGFTLADLVSYNEKHNLRNGENNADGCNANFSWNCGVEGVTDSPEICALRQRQIKNFATILLFAHGVPLILAGDEIARTQLGNNNAYCQDNEIGWVNWSLLEANTGLFRFFRLLIQFRKRTRLLRWHEFDDGASGRFPKVCWHGINAGQPDWSDESRTLAMHLSNEQLSALEPFTDIYLIANAHWQSHTFELPTLSVSKRWFRSVDTMKDTPNDICELSKEVLLENQRCYHVGPRSVVILVGK